MLCQATETTVQSCQPKAAGCPVSCTGTDEHVCHTPAVCDGCEASNVCSTAPCPVYCSAGETKCVDPDSGALACHPREEGCPMSCAVEQHMCHVPPACETCVASNFCSHAPCPVACGQGEVVCTDPKTQEQSCHAPEDGCPVTCADGLHACRLAPACVGCETVNYCSATPCPAACNRGEALCVDAATKQQTCHPRAEGCPVTCSADEHLCRTPALCEDCDVVNHCSQTPCPVLCSANETACTDHLTREQSCQPRETGCPVTCRNDERVCRTHGVQFCAPVASTCPLGSESAAKREVFFRRVVEKPFASLLASNSSLLLAANSSSKTSVHGDPMFKYGDRATHFWLPAGKLAVLLRWNTTDGNNYTLFGKTFDRVDSQSQWLDQVIVKRNKHVVLDASAKKGTFSTMTLVLDGQQLDDTVPEGGMAQMISQRVGFSATASKLADRDSMGKTHAEKLEVDAGGLTMSIYSSRAAKFAASAKQAKYMHLNLVLRAGVTATATGLFAQLAGVQPLTNQTKTLLKPMRSLKEVKQARAQAVASALAAPSMQQQEAAVAPAAAVQRQAPAVAPAAAALQQYPTADAPTSSSDPGVDASMTPVASPFQANNPVQAPADDKVTEAKDQAKAPADQQLTPQRYESPPSTQQAAQPKEDQPLPPAADNQAKDAQGVDDPYVLPAQDNEAKGGRAKVVAQEQAEATSRHRSKAAALDQTVALALRMAKQKHENKKVTAGKKEEDKDEEDEGKEDEEDETDETDEDEEDDEDEDGDFLPKAKNAKKAKQALRAQRQKAKREKWAARRKSEAKGEALVLRGPIGKGQKGKGRKHSALEPVQG